jgi:hypothetical protein
MLDPSSSPACTGMCTCAGFVHPVAGPRDSVGGRHTVSVTAGLPSLARNSPNREEAVGGDPPGAWLVMGSEKVDCYAALQAGPRGPRVRSYPHSVHRMSTFAARSGVVVHRLWRPSSLERPYGVGRESDTAV